MGFLPGRAAHQGLVAGGCSLALLVACAAPPAAAPAAPAQPARSTAGAAAAAPTAVPMPVAAAAAPEPAVVRVGILNSAGDAAFSIGIEKGYYAEQGLTIETVPFDSAARMIAPLSQGQLETGQGVIGAGAMNAVARGVDIRGIAGASGSPPGHGNSSFIVRKELWDSGALRTPADLRGRRVALTARGTGIEVLWAKLLERGGLTADDVEMIQLNFGEQVTALGNSAVDVITPSEPAATVALDRGYGTLWMRSDELIPDHLTSFIWAGPHFAANTDVAQRFMLGALKAIRLYNDAFFKNNQAAKDEVISIFIKHTPVKERDLYDRMVFQGFDPDGRINRAVVEGDMAYYVATGQLPALIDLDQLIDMRFADYAVQVLGPYPR